MFDSVRRERPGEVRLRILSLTAHFISDMDKLDADKRARVMVAFEQWQVSSLRGPSIPIGTANALWDLALNVDAPLTDWLFKVTDMLDQHCQHFICRNVDCTSVIHNHH